MAVKKIMDMRRMRESGHDESVGVDSFRVSKIPEINLNAKTLSDLIDLDIIQPGSEPPLTCSLTNVQVRAFLDNPMYVPSWPSHPEYTALCAASERPGGHVQPGEEGRLHPSSGGQQGCNQ